MFKKFILTFSILLLSLYTQASFAYSVPVQDVFSDINSNYKYINELQTLYDKWMIIPDSNWKFNPRELLNRDEFVWILWEVTCKKCIQPNTALDLVTKYENKTVFYDINKTNKYFYCIADSSNSWYVSGYHPWTACEDWSKKDGEKPFCSNNTIILEEALSIILRASWILTNEEADKVRQDIADWKITKNLSDDVTPKYLDWSVYSFYPDFQKALDYKLLDIDKNGNVKNYNLLEVVDWKIRPKQTISKEDFLRIAFVALKANSCNQKSENKIPIDMIVYNKSCDSNKSKCNLSDLNDADNTYDFTLKSNIKCDKWVNEPDWYIWRFYNNNTWEEIKKYWKYIDNYKFLKNWEYKVFVRVKDNCWNTWEVSNILSVGSKWIWMDINASNINWNWPLLVDYSATVNWWALPYTYFWDFWDGNTWYWKDSKNVYRQVWVYTVVLYITDKNWKITSSTMTIQVDSISTDIVDSDLDWMFDNNDLCPLIKGSMNNKWCPMLEETCNVNKSCRKWSFCNEKNICEPNILSSSCEYSWGNIIFWNAICNSCPCDYSLDFVSTLRKCDLIFPAIVSPDDKSIYSRGDFYQVK